MKWKKTGTIQIITIRLEVIKNSIRKPWFCRTTDTKNGLDYHTLDRLYALKNSFKSRNAYRLYNERRLSIKAYIFWILMEWTHHSFHSTLSVINLNLQNDNGTIIKMMNRENLTWSSSYYHCNPIKDKFFWLFSPICSLLLTLFYNLYDRKTLKSVEKYSNVEWMKKYEIKNIVKCHIKKARWKIILVLKVLVGMERILSGKIVFM